MNMFSRTQADRQVDELEAGIESMIENAAINIKIRLQSPVRGWSMLAALAKRDDPQDKTFTEKNYLTENEAHFNRSVAAANIEIVNMMIRIAFEIEKLPQNKRNKNLEKLHSKCEEAVASEAGEEANNPVQVASIVNIPLSGIDISTFLETQKEILVKEKARVELVYHKLFAINEEIISSIKLREASEPDDKVKRYLSSLRGAANSAYKNQSVPTSYEECMEYIRVADELINAAMRMEYCNITVSAPLLVTDLEYMHKHGSEVHYRKG